MKRWISPALSLVATVYTIWYMHYGIPYKNSGALSKIGLGHPVAFTIWGVLTMSALAVAVVIGYRKYTNTRIYIPLLAVSAVGMALTLCFDFVYDDRVSYYLHCGGSLAFSATMGVTVFLLFLLCYNRGTLFRVLTFVTAFVLVADLVCLICFKETGLIESLPIFVGYIMLAIADVRRENIAVAR